MPGAVIIAGDQPKAVHRGKVLIRGDAINTLTSSKRGLSSTRSWCTARRSYREMLRAQTGPCYGARAQLKIRGVWERMFGSYDR